MPEHVRAERQRTRGRRLSKAIDRTMEAMLGTFRQVRDDGVALHGSRGMGHESQTAEFEVLREEIRHWFAEYGLEHSPRAKLIDGRFDQLIKAAKRLRRASNNDAAVRAARDAAALIEHWKAKRQRPEKPQTPYRTAEPDEPAESEPTFPLASAYPVNPPAFLSESHDTTAPLGVQQRIQLWIDSFTSSWSLMPTVHADESGPPLAPPVGATTCNYTVNDLADALPEVDVAHPRIRALAAELGYSPLKIFEYVKNTIEFHPYYGSLKGAVGTLVSGSGNTTDHSALLVALLRASKIPARFVHLKSHHVQTDPGLHKWMGVKSYDAVRRRLTNNRWPYWSWTRRHSENAMILPVVVVQACIAYDDYRGSGSGDSGFRWIPLDPSYKSLSYTQSQIAPADFLFDQDQYLSRRTTTYPEDAFINQLEAHLGTPLNGFGYEGRIKPVKHDVLPGSLPYEVYKAEPWSATQTDSESASIPASHRNHVRFEVLNAQGNPMAYAATISMPTLLSGRMTLSFEGKTQADRDALDQWRAEGGAVPCDAALVGPVFRHNGVPVNASPPLGYTDLCDQNLQLKVNVFRPQDRIDIFGETSVEGNSVHDESIHAANFYAIQVYGYQDSPELLETLHAELLEKIGANSNPLALPDDALGAYLHLIGLKWMRYTARATRIIGQLHGETGDVGNNIGMVSATSRADYVFDLPLAISANSLLVDIPSSINSSGSLTTSDSVSYESFLMSARAGSAYESVVLEEQTQMDAVSTVSGLQLASEQSIGYATVTSSTQVDSVLANGPCGAGAAYTNNDLDLFKELFTSGYDKVVAPRCRIQLNDWKGKVYVAEDHDHPYYVSLSISGGVAANGGESTNLVPDPVTEEESLSPGVQAIEPEHAEQPLRVTNVTNGHTTGLTRNSTESGDPVNLVSGNMYHADRDIRVAGRGGLDFAFERYYNSHYVADGPLGHGWTHSYNHKLTFPGDNPNLIPEVVLWTDGTGATRKFTPDTASLATETIAAINLSNAQAAEIAPGARRIYQRGDGERYIEIPNVVEMVGAPVMTPIVTQQALGYRIIETQDAGGISWFLEELPADAWNTAKVDLVPTSLKVLAAETGNTLTLTTQTYDLVAGSGVNESARKGAGGLFEIHERNGLTYYFEPVSAQDGQRADLVRVVDANGNSFTFTRDAQDRLVSVTDDLGKALSFHYDNADKHITRITDWAGRIHRYTYDTDGNLISHETPEAVEGRRQPSQYTYYNATDGPNLDHAMETITDPNGNAMTFEYYANGKTFRHTNSHGKSYTFYYNVYRRETRTVDEAGIENRYLFNEWGMQLEHIRGDGTRMRYTYDDERHPYLETTRRNPLGYITTNTFDDDGNLTVKTLPDGSTLEYSDYSAFAQPGRVKDARGNVTLNSYDALGNLTQTTALKAGVDTLTPTTDQILARTQLTYDAHGNVLTRRSVRDFTTGEGPEIRYSYDADGLNVTQVEYCGLQQDANGVLTQRCTQAPQTHDSLRRPVLTTGPDLYDSEVVYDLDGRPVRSTDALGYWHDLGYDDNGNPIADTLTTLESDGMVRTVSAHTIEYDSLGRPIRQSNLAGHSIRTAYDAIGNVTSVTDADGYTVHTEYDAMNRVTRTYDEGGFSASTEYDIGGRPVSNTDPNGHTTTFSYYGIEQNGRLQSVTRPDGITEAYEYDPNGNITRTTVGGQFEQLTQFDALNRPVRHVGPVDPGLWGTPGARKVTRNVYDALGRLEKVEAGYTTSATDSSADVVSTQVTHAYDDFGRLARIFHQRSEPKNILGFSAGLPRKMSL